MRQISMFSGDQIGMIKAYFLLLRPSSKLFNEVNVFKEKVDRYLGASKYIHSFPHITLLQFLMNEKSEASFIEMIEKSELLHAAASLKTSGFGEYHTSNTLYIKIVNQEFVKSKLDLILENRMTEKISMKLIHKVHDLHLTIARQIGDKDYAAVRDMIFSMVLDEGPVLLELMLLKRGDISEHWTPVKTFTI